MLRYELEILIRVVWSRNTSGEKWTAPSGTFKLERGQNKQKLAKKWFISNDNISVNNGAISILIRFLKSA